MFIEARINRRRILSVGASDPAYDLGRRVFVMPVWHVHVAEKVLETQADSALPMSCPCWNREGDPIAAAHLLCECAHGGVFEGRALCRPDIAGEDAAEDVAGLVADSRQMDHSMVASLKMDSHKVATLKSDSRRTTRITAHRVGMPAKGTTAVVNRA